MPATMEQRHHTSNAERSRPGFVRRWLRRLPLLIGLLSLLGWFLPTLIAVTPLRNLVVRAAAPRLPKGIEVGSARLSWTGPMELRDVRIPDDSGGSLLEVERIETETSLWELATEGFSRALFHVFRPRLRIVMKENSTTIDSSVYQFVDRHVGTGKPLALDLENGLITFVNQQGDVLTEITDVTLTLEMTPGAGGSAGVLELNGRIVREDEDGRLSLNAEWSGGGAEERTGHIVLDVARLPADALGPLLSSRLDGRTLTGEITGDVEARWNPEDGLLAGDLELNADQLLIELVSNQAGATVEVATTTEAEGGVHRWEFRDSMVRARGRYDSSQDHAELAELVIDSDIVALTAAGEISGVSSRPVVDLEGELNSNPEVLLAFLEESLPESLQIENVSIREFSAGGPLSELTSLFQGRAGTGGHGEQLDLGARVSWSALDFYGIRSPNGIVDARVSSGELQLTPLDVSVSGGRVESLPNLDLTASPRVFVLNEGPVVRNVAFTEEMCRTWLKYVSPLLADATGMEGQFSISSRGGRVPLPEPRAADVAGTLQVHAGRVGPGPLARQIVDIVEQVRALAEGRVPTVFGGGRRPQRTWLELPEQNVDVRVADGRVHHDGMRYVAGDVTVVTRGSVGMDDSLDAVLEIPLRDEWLEENRYLASMKGQTIEVPLRGTLDEPQVDARAVNRLIEQMATRAGAGLLQQLLDR